MNQNTKGKKKTLLTVVIHRPAPHGKVPVEFAVLWSCVKGSARPHGDNEETYLSSTPPPESLFFPPLQ